MDGGERPFIIWLAGSDHASDKRDQPSLANRCPAKLFIVDPLLLELCQRVLLLHLSNVERPVTLHPPAFFLLPNTFTLVAVFSVEISFDSWRTGTGRRPPAEVLQSGSLGGFSELSKSVSS